MGQTATMPMSRRLGSAFPPQAVAAPGERYDTAFEIGRDHARHALTPPLEQLCINPRLQQGFRAGREALRGRTRAPTPAVRRWLLLRLEALASRRCYESVALTPNYLEQLSLPQCPVTRERFGPGAEPRVTRLRPDAGFAAGHLVWLGVRAHAAKGELSAADAWERARRCAAARNGPARIDGLTGEQWARLATLCSFVTPLAHEAAAALPLHALPPNRLRMFNPVQALQASVARALAHETPNKRLAALRAALLLPAHRSAFDTMIEAYRAALAGVLRSRPGMPAQWAVTDAWADHLLQTRWKRFARGLTPAQCEAAALASGEPFQAVADLAATEGWALDEAGLLPQARLRSTRAGSSLRDGGRTSAVVGPSSGLGTSVGIGTSSGHSRSAGGPLASRAGRGTAPGADGAPAAPTASAPAHRPHAPGAQPGGAPARLPEPVRGGWRQIALRYLGATPAEV